jgi:SAM-dependent methyltransferase
MRKLRHALALILGRVLNTRIFGRISTTRLVYYIAIMLVHTANRIRFTKSLHKLALRTPPEMLGRHDWIRLPMYDAIYQFFLELAKRENIKGRIAIEIGGCEGTIKSILESFAVQYVVAPNFPEVDVQHLPYEDNSFDFVILDQVLEHVERPWIAVDEVYRILRPSGISIVTAPFLIHYHALPPWKDYYRYTPDAWRVLFYKFDILVSDGWGNAETICAIVSNSMGDCPAGCMISLPQAIERHLLEGNDGKCYIVTWCIARKPNMEVKET